MKKTATRVIAMALILLMALALIPMGARAEGEYTVAFDSRSSFARGTMASVSFENGTVTLPRCAFHPEGFAFVEWLDESNESKRFPDGATITLEDAGLNETRHTLTLGAIWKEHDPVTVSFSGNEADGGAMGDVSVPYDRVYTVPACGFTRTNYTFVGWRGSDGKSYAVGDTLPLTAAFSFSALWEQNTVSVSFDGNGAADTMAAVSHPAGNVYTVPACGFTAPEGKVFAGWKDANGQSYQANDTITGLAADLTLTAQWESIQSETGSGTSSFTVHFDANGGRGTMEDAIVTNGTLQAPPCTFTNTNGRGFRAWNTSGDGQGTQYMVGRPISVAADMTLYAIWEELNGNCSIDKTSANPGDTLTASFECTSGDSSGLYYQWRANLSETLQDSASRTYQVQERDRGKTITCTAHLPGLPASFLSTNSVTVAAASVPETVTVTVYVNDYGTVLYNGAPVNRTVTVPKGSTSAFEFARQSDSCRVKSVTLNGVDVTGQSQLTFDRNSTLAVTFEKGLPGGDFTVPANLQPKSTVTHADGMVEAIFDIKPLLKQTVEVPDRNNVYPTTPVSFVLPYPKAGMNKDNYNYTLIHVPDSKPVEITATARGLEGSSVNFSDFDMSAAPKSNTLIGDVIISGSPIIGKSLTASVANTNNTGTLTYTWKRGGTTVGTGPSYTTTAADDGATLVCEVTSSVQSGSISATVYPATKPKPVVISYIYFGDTTKPGEIGNVSPDMEYALSVEGPWYHLTGNTLAGLTTPGTYYFRLEKNHDAMGSAVVKAFSWVTADTMYGKGSVTPATQTVENGSNLVLEFTPRKNYQVAEVRVNGVRVPNMRNATYLNLKNITGRAEVKVGFYYAGNTPHTGDDSHLTQWCELAALSLVGLAAVIVLLKRKSKA